MKISINFKQFIAGVAIILVIITSIRFFILGKNQSSAPPETMDLRSISELSLVQCYFNNVARFEEEDAARSWIFFTKDKQFWLEYEAYVVLGMDSSLISAVIDNNVVTVTLPPVGILYSEVIPTSITEESFILADKSAKITADDELLAIKEAQKEMEERVANNSSLHSTTKERAKVLLTNYIHSIGEQVGVNYTIVWDEL